MNNLLRRLICLVIVFIAFVNVLIAQLPDYVPASGLIAYYGFNGNANDLSGNGNTGTVSGPTYITDRYGNPDAAVNYVGMNERITTNKIDRTTTNTFSYSVWVEPVNSATIPVQNSNVFLFGTDFSSACVIDPVNGWNWSTVSPATDVGAGLYVGTNGVYILEHGPSIITDQLSWSGTLTGWHHIVVVYESQLPKLYIDGSFVQNGVISGRTVHPSVACDYYTPSVGVYPYIAAGFGHGIYPFAPSPQPTVNFTGNIDDIAIYNRALTPCEITRLYDTIPPTTLTGVSELCATATTTLSSVSPGGTWLSSNTGIAMVGSGTGIVTGVSGGTATINYVLGGSCSASTTVTVTALPSLITGTANVCQGASITLSYATTGGTWSISPSGTGIATVNPASGLVTGLAAGTATISYSITLSCGAAYPALTVTTDPLPAAITGMAAICSGTTAALYETSTGGTWSSSSTAIATVNAGTGIVTGLSAGTATITYAPADGCFPAVAIVTVNPLPLAITGTMHVCSGLTTTLSDAASGGTWSSMAPATATIGSTNGIVAGVAVGTATISYTLLTNGCAAVTVVTVNPEPLAITGVLSMCSATTTALSDGTGGGSWSSGSTGIATVGATGIVTGLSTGTATITYALADGCFPATAIVTVNPLPPVITGAMHVCTGFTATLSDAASGGTWSSTNTVIATAGLSSGIVSGIIGGTTTISYMLPTGCGTATIVTVTPTPASIVAMSTVCAGATTTLYSGSTGSPSGGNWNSSNTAIATIGSSSGAVGGVAGGTASITYTLPTGCNTVFPITVSPQPASITGIINLCIGITTTLTDSTAGGSWSSSNTSIADIGPLLGTLSAGFATGATTISYTLGSGCAATAVVMVSVGPLPISGTLAWCQGATTVLSDGIAGGSWSSSGPGIATVDSVYGTVYGVATGATTISYALGACAVTAIVTVNASPPAISGVTEVCVGLATLLTDATTGGTWSSSNASIASIVGATGILTGGGAGTATTSYTLPGGCAATRTETVNTTPPAITGVAMVCLGALTTLTDAGGGSWSSGNTAVATVSVSGGAGAGGATVTGVAVGTASIIYSIGAGCSISTTVTVNALPPAISGIGVMCAGATTLLSDGAGAWTSGNASVATIGSVSGIITGVSGGTTIVTYTASSTGCTAHTTVTVNVQPAAITGTLAVCVGATTILSDHTTGGVWSSSATATATVSAGVVSGVTSGTAGIAYTNPATGCAAHATLTVNPLPLAITGTLSVCAGASTTLLDGTSGGVWTSASTSVSVGAGGTVTGVSGGTAVISYTLPTGCGRTTTVTANALPTITGPTAECVGAVIGESIPIAIGTTGGTWSSSVATVATVGSSGSVTGVATGTTVITYTSLPGCKATATITVSLSPDGIIGASAVCAGNTTTLSDAVGGGVWSSSNSAAATVGSLSGAVTGVAVGTTIISYSLGSTGCTVTKILTVNAAPAGITGGMSMCVSATTILADATTGGVWSSSGSGTAEVSGGVGVGIVTGVATGTAAITYTHGGCSVSTTVTVNLTPTAIIGARSVCAGDSIALSDGIGGGVWTSSNTGVATVDAGGYVTGLSPATATITYSLGAGCTVTKIITVNPISAITGSMGMCVGTTSALSDAATGGAWSSGATAIASVNTGGITTGALAGTSVITYTTTAGCTVTAVITVNLAPSAISGALYVCAGATTSLGNTAGGGLWTSSNTAVAAIGSTAIVTGIVPGTTIITYSLGSGCIVTAMVTVDAVPPAITGTMEVCAGDTTALGDASTTGIWSSGSSAIATVIPIAIGTGVVSGVSAGTVAISYRLAGGCAATATITVNPLPAPIAGATLLCAGLTTTLASATTAGAWTSGSTSVATVDPVLGVVRGVAPGTAAITYTLPSGCIAVTMATINAAPAAITGSLGMCIGSGTSLSDPSGGGIWSSSNTSIAVVSAGVGGAGAVSGIGLGTATISYTVGGCPATAVVTISSLPDAISSTSLCVGSAETLTDLPGGGTWSTSNAGIATIDETEGVLTGVSAGTTTIAYSLGVGCTVTTAVTVNALPGAITGTPEVCLGYTTTLTDPAGSGSGVWSSSNTAIAAVSGTGAVSGIAGGPVTISYTSHATGCAATRLVTVIVVPAISGVSDMCAFSSVASVSDGITGGTWTSTSVTVSTAGVVTPYSAGAASLTYTIPLGCYVTTSFIVHPLPGPVTGILRFCRGMSTTLADTTSGGIWSSSNGAVAPVIPIAIGAGMVSGLSGGTVVISYELSTGCMETATITIDSFPIAGTITGLLGVCTGATIVLTDLSAGGAWSSSNTLADVLGGMVSGLSAGMDTIKYTVSNTCGTASTSKTITINSPPIGYTVTGGGSYCAGGSGVHIGLSGSNTGINYQLYHGATLSGSATGTGIAVDFGLQTAVGVYTAFATNTATGCTINMLGSATVTITPAVIPAVNIAPGTGDTICAGAAITFTATPLNGGSASAYQWLVNNTVIPGATAGLYTYTPVNGDEVKTMLISSATCATPNTVSDSAVIAVVTPVTPTVAINASPGTTIQQGQSDTLIAIIPSGGFSPAYQWEINGNPIAGATMASFTNNYYANDTVTCMVSVGGICNAEGTGSVVILVSNVGVNTLPTEKLITIVPNPNNGTFTIKGSLGTGNEEVSLDISDMLGQSIYQSTINAPGGNINTRLSLSSALARGVYILRLASGGTMHTYRVVVE